MELSVTDGNRTSRTRLSTAAADDYKMELEWDIKRRLTKVTLKNNSDAVTKTVEYQYDMYNRLIFKTVDGVAYRYVYDGDQILLVLENDQVTNNYLWGPAVDQLLADESFDVNNPADDPELLWALTDQVGTVRDLAKYDSVAGETNVVNHISYNAFGKQMSATDAAIISLFGNTGKYFDTDTGLQWSNARWYDPNTQTWISEDFIPGDPRNTNRYLRNDPINNIDPSGLVAIAPWKQIGGSAPAFDFSNGSPPYENHDHPSDLPDSILDGPPKILSQSELENDAERQALLQAEFEHRNFPTSDFEFFMAGGRRMPLKGIGTGTHMKRFLIIQGGRSLIKGRGAGRVGSGSSRPVAGTPTGKAVPVTPRPVSKKAPSSSRTGPSAEHQRNLDRLSQRRADLNNLDRRIRVSEGAPSAATRGAVRTPWGRQVRQRSDIDWDFVRPEGTSLAGQTNRAAAQRGYTPIRINPQTGKVDDVVLHHSLDDPRGAVIETWRSSHTRFHQTIGREPNPWRQQRPDWAEAWRREQSAYWRWRTGAYNPPPQSRLRLPGDPQ